MDNLPLPSADLLEIVPDLFLKPGDIVKCHGSNRSYRVVLVTDWPDRVNMVQLEVLLEKDVSLPYGYRYYTEKLGMCHKIGREPEDASLIPVTPDTPVGTLLFKRENPSEQGILLQVYPSAKECSLSCGGVIHLHDLVVLRKDGYKRYTLEACSSEWAVYPYITTSH